MHGRFPNLELLLIESGGDNLSATFNPELADFTIFVIDVAEGDKIPRKGGPGITRSDLLVINKIDLAPYVGADLKVMERDSKKMRGEKPFIFTNIRAKEALRRCDRLDQAQRFIGRLMNTYAQESKLRLKTKIGADGRCVIEDNFFTPPLSSWRPFTLKTI